MQKISYNNNKNKKVGEVMSIIKSASDFNKNLLKNVSSGNPVILTEDGDQKYAIMDIDDYNEYEKKKAIEKLMIELEYGQNSVKDKSDWISANKMHDMLKV